VRQLQSQAFIAPPNEVTKPEWLLGTSASQQQWMGAFTRGPSPPAESSLGQYIGCNK